MTVQNLRAKSFATALLCLLASALDGEFTTETEETSETEQMTTCLLQKAATLAMGGDDMNQFVPQFQQNQLMYPYAGYDQQLHTLPQSNGNLLGQMPVQSMQRQQQQVHSSGPLNFSPNSMQLPSLNLQMLSGSTFGQQSAQAETFDLQNEENAELKKQNFELKRFQNEESTQLKEENMELKRELKEQSMKFQQELKEQSTEFKQQLKEQSMEFKQKREELQGELSKVYSLNEGLQTEAKAARDLRTAQTKMQQQEKRDVMQVMAEVRNAQEKVRRAEDIIHSILPADKGSGSEAQNLS